MTYEMTPQLVRDTIKAIQDANKAINDRLDDSEREAKKLIDDDWTGDARDSYDDEKIKWDQDVKDMNRILNEQAAPALNAMVDETEGTEGINSREWMHGGRRY